jgi:hypothetical protein
VLGCPGRPELGLGRAPLLCCALAAPPSDFVNVLLVDPLFAPPTEHVAAAVGHERRQGHDPSEEPHQKSDTSARALRERLRGVECPADQRGNSTDRHEGEHRRKGVLKPMSHEVVDASSEKGSSRCRHGRMMPRIGGSRWRLLCRGARLGQNAGSVARRRVPFAMCEVRHSFWASAGDVPRRATKLMTI